MSQYQELLQTITNFRNCGNNSSFQTISALLKQLSDQLRESPSNCSVASFAPDLISSLIKFCNYKYQTNIEIDEDKIVFDIKQFSQNCLRSIQCNGNQAIQSKLSHAGYARAMIEYVEIRNKNQNNGNKIGNTFGYICNFLSELRNGRPQNLFQPNIPSFIPQLYLAVLLYEQIEDSGGNEDIDAYTFNIEGWQSNIRNNAKTAKFLLLNFSQDSTNPKNRSKLVFKI